MKTIFAKSFFLILGVWFFVPTSSVAVPPQDIDFSVAEALGEDIAIWISRLENPPQSVAIYSVNPHDPFTHDFSNMLEVETIKFLGKRGITKTSTCLECRMPQVMVHQSEVVISKGAPDIDSIKRVGRRVPTESLLVVEVYKTKLNVVAHAVLYTNPEGQMLSSERFTIPSVNVADTAVQFLITFGSGAPSYQVAQDYSSSTALMGALNVALLEEIGFGKGGLNLGLLLTPAGTLIYLTPQLGFRGRFGTSSLRWGFDLAGGYGLMGNNRGLLGRTTFDLFVSNWAVVGVEAMYFMPPNPEDTSITSYIGGHIGFSLGR